MRSGGAFCAPGNRFTFLVSRHCQYYQTVRFYPNRPANHAEIRRSRRSTVRLCSSISAVNCPGSSLSASPFRLPVCAACRWLSLRARCREPPAGTKRIMRKCLLSFMLGFIMPLILERNHGKKLDRVGVSPLVLLLEPYISPSCFRSLRLLRSGYDAPSAHPISISLLRNNNVIRIVINIINLYIYVLIINKIRIYYGT